MNATENQFQDALTILKEGAENRTSYILHPGKMIGDENSVKKFQHAEDQQMSQHFLYGDMSAVQTETEWWQYILDFAGLTFSKQSILNKWSYQQMQTATEKSVYQMSFSTLLMKSDNIAEQADEISLQVNNLLAGVLNPEKTYLTAGVLSVSEIKEILAEYPEICLSLPEFFMPGRVPMSTAMPQGGNQLLLADIYISKCNKTYLGAQNVDLSRAEKIENLEQKLVALNDSCKRTKSQLAAENLSQAEKIKSLEQQMVAFNETLSTFRDYAKVSDTQGSHYSLWTAGIVTLVVVVAFFGGVTAAILSRQYTLKRRADFQDVRQEIANRAGAASAEQFQIAETEGL